jgi:ABC-type sugar transport system ATPase subunit
LDRVDIDIYPGQVHAVVGENGAGKSTLMKLLGGVYQPDSGQITLRGKRVSLRSPHEAIRAGVSVIYQELDLAGHLTVAENIYLGREPRRLGLLTDHRALHRRATDLLADLGIHIPGDTFVNRLGLASCQMVEIAKALSRDARIIIMDEPTASLSERETAVLFALVRRLRSEGRAIVYISHRLKEIFEIADHVTVMRDGRIVGSHSIGQVTRRGLVRMMVGREIDESAHRPAAAGAPMLRVRDLSLQNKFANVSFDLHEGEIVGISGLAGCGREELVRAIFGLRSYDSGSVELAGRRLPRGRPDLSIQRGLCFLSEDRRSEGIFAQMSVRANLTAMVLRKLAMRLSGLIRPSAERALLRRYTGEMSIKYALGGQEIRLLSGGNQQKVLLSRAVAGGGKVLILCEPTRGVDVGAKSEIYDLMNRLTRQGMALLVVSSDLPEILCVCDRSLIMFQGRLTGDISAAELTEESIMLCATGEGPERNGHAQQ